MCGKLKLTLPMVLLFLFFLNLAADSPLTSTAFYSAYSDIDMVQKAAKSGVLTEEVAGFLSCKENSIDVKAAVINALSWDINGKNSYEFFSKVLKKKYNKGVDSLILDELTGDEVFCLGYLLAMDDYFDVYDALDILDIAWGKNDTSFTVSMIYALVEAQAAMDYDWCEVWELIKDELNDKTLKRDMREGAVDLILDYMKLYREYCNGGEDTLDE